MREGLPIREEGTERRIDQILRRDERANGFPGFPLDSQDSHLITNSPKSGSVAVSIERRGIFHRN